MAYNYPDDIAQYKNDPRSPDCIEPTYECEHCCEHYESCDMANETTCSRCNKQNTVEEQINDDQLLDG